MNSDRIPNFQFKPHELSSTTNVVPHLAKQRSSEQLEYELRLLSLYIDEVRGTGEIDYPELVQYLNQVFEVDSAPPGAVLMPAAIDTLVTNLQTAQAKIHFASVQIQQNLHLLADAITHPDLTETQEKELDREIHQGTERFLKAVEYILDLTHRYLYTHRQNLQVEDIDFEWVRKLMNDLKYLRQYIAEQAQVRVIKSEFLPGDSQKSYFRRLYKYLEIAPGLADILGNLVQQTLERKVAGGKKFVTPKPY